MTILKLNIVVSITFLLMACAIIPDNKKQYLDPTIISKPHTILAGEQILVTVFGQVDLTKTYRIDDKGSLSLPLLGNIDANNKTPQQLANYIAAQLGQKYIRNPSVTVEMVTYSPVYITGAIKNAGQFSYSPGMTAEAAIAAAGGFLSTANQQLVKITRRQDGHVFEANVALQTPLSAGDIVRVYGSLNTN